jgi:hypothetical protein
MRKFLAAVGMFVVMLVPAVNANASETNKCCGDGKVPTVAAQTAACKGTSGKTFTACRTLAKLPEWWLAELDNGRTIHIHVESGVTLINNVRKVQPYWSLLQDFNNNIKAYRDQHVHVGPNA